MLALLKGWLLNNTLRLIGYGAAALSISAILLGARQAGRNTERVDQLKKILEIKNAQLNAAANAPRTRGELVDRLRDGEF